MTLAVNLHDRLCDVVIWLLLRIAVAVDTYRGWAHRHARRLRGSLRELLRQRWIGCWGPKPTAMRRRRAHNRTPEHVEQQVVRLHVEQPQLGTGQLMRLCERVLGFVAARETFR